MEARSTAVRNARARIDPPRELVGQRTHCSTASVRERSSPDRQGATLFNDAR